MKIEFEAKNFNNLEAAIERLNSVFQEASQDIYNAGNAEGGSQEGAAQGNPQDEVTDVDFEEVEDAKK